MKPEKRLEIESRIAALLQERGTGVPCHEAYELLYPDQVPEHYFRGVFEHILGGLGKQAGTGKPQAVESEAPATVPATDN